MDEAHIREQRVLFHDDDGSLVLKARLPVEIGALHVIAAVDFQVARTHATWMPIT